MPSSISRAGLLLAGGILAAAPGAGLATPLSAIDWLSQSIEPSEPDTAPEADAPAASLPAEVSTAPLAAPIRETPGLVAAADLGLPGDLWSGSTADAIVVQLAQVDATLPPNARDLLRRVLISRQASPLQGDDRNVLTAARVDLLLQMGALDEARLLLGARAPATPELFRRWFDIALLTGSETEACRDMAAQPDVSPTYPARVFCLARNGDWDVAAQTLGTAQSLDILTEAEAALLARFLDPEIFLDIPTPPHRPSPLVFRLYEAAGDRLPTAALPVAFAHADRSAFLGWKTRIEASERLARAGVISPNELFAVYGEQAAAASGGVWDRVAAIARLNTAIAIGAADASDFDRAYRVMSRAGLGHVFATAYQRLPDAPGQSRPARDTLLSLAALQGQAQLPSAYLDPTSEDDQFLAAVAAGTPVSAPARGLLAQAITEGFQRRRIAGPLTQLRDAGRHGEALLMALNQIGEAAEGDIDQLAAALSHLRAIGLEETARRIALDLLIEARRA